MTEAENFARDALRWSQRRHNDEFGRREAGKGEGDVSVDLQEFGRLQAQVETLVRADEVNTKLLREMAAAINSIQLQLAEARGGWRTLMWLGGASAAAGGTVMALLHKLFRVLG